ncbi:unnamed protein product, partial [Ilex paraguariensis]
MLRNEFFIKAQLALMQHLNGMPILCERARCVRLAVVADQSKRDGKQYVEMFCTMK